MSNNFGLDCVFVISSTMSDNDNKSDMECSETEDYFDYYDFYEDIDSESLYQKRCDPEHVEFECLTVDQVIYEKKCIMSISY